MSGRPAAIKQRDCKQVLEAAKKAGAKEVRFLFGEVPVIIPLVPEPSQESLPDSNNSFDRIMRDK